MDNRSSGGQTRRRIAVAVSPELMICLSCIPIMTDREGDSVNDAENVRLNAAEIQAMVRAAQIVEALEQHRVSAHS